MSDLTVNVNQISQSPGKLRGWIEVVVVALLLPVGAVLGSLTGFAPMASIVPIALSLAAATLFLHSEGVRWRDITFGTALRPGQVALFTVVAVVITYGAVFVLTWVLQNLLGAPKVDISRFETLLSGNLVMYLTFMVLVVWGSAAIGEELLARGFLQHRLEGLTNLPVGAVLQASIFASVHFYQGITGVLSIFVLALVFTAVYVRCGRNLVPLIIAHGLIDTIALTLIYLGYGHLLVGV